MKARTGQTLIYLLSDYVLLNVGWLLYTLVRYRVLPPEYTSSMSFGQHLLTMPVMAGQILIPLMMMGFYWLSGYYNNAFFKSRVEELFNTLAVSALGSVVIFFVVLINDKFEERLANYEMIGLMWLMLSATVYVGRVIITSRVADRIRKREIAFNTLVVGTGTGARKLVSRLEGSDRGNGFRIVGFVKDPDGGGQPDSVSLGFPVYDFKDMKSLVGELNIQRLIVMPEHAGIRETGELISFLFTLDLPIYVTPDLHGLILMRPKYVDVAGEPMVDITSTATPASTVNCKRFSDVVVSFFGLLLLSPVYLLLALAVRLDSKGPVFYLQERIGYHKKRFNIIKFRTMKVDAESMGPSLSSPDDPRATRIGRFMRKYRLDELPQFYNVLKGDMSLVGPRPEREYYIDRIVSKAPYYSLVHQVRPGITSWGMVKFGYATDVDQMIERLRYDLIYIENVSLPVDLKILFYTVNTVFTGKGL